MRGHGTDPDGDGVRIVAQRSVAVIVAERRLRVITRRLGRFAADVDLGGLAADERVLDDSVRSFLTGVPKLLSLLENLLTSPYVDGKGNEYNEPALKSALSAHARGQIPEWPTRPVRRRSLLGGSPT